MASAVTIPASGPVRGSLRPPPSKSLTHRYLNLTLLSGRPRTLVDPLEADDTHLFAAALEALGWSVVRHPGRWRVDPPPAGSAVATAEVLCGNAGTMARFLVATLCVLPGSFRLDGVPRLRERPVRELVSALTRLGAEVEYAGREGYLPLAFEGTRGLPGGRTRLDAGSSSQYLSALLMAAQRASQPVEIEVAELRSAPYVEITLATLREFGGSVSSSDGLYRVEPGPLIGPPEVRVEVDASAACYPASAAALTAGEVTVLGLRRDSPQGDRNFLDLLQRMGAQVGWQEDGVTVRGGELVAIDADLGSMPDQVPTLAALAPFARGTTRITGVPHLRIKESDRLHAMASGLTRLGVPVEEREDGLVVPGVWADREPPADEVEIDSFDDHRIAMSFALVGLRRRGVRVADPEVVGKSYPQFWADLDRLRS